MSRRLPPCPEQASELETRKGTTRKRRYFTVRHGTVRVPVTQSFAGVILRQTELHRLGSVRLARLYFVFPF